MLQSSAQKHTASAAKAAIGADDIFSVIKSELAQVRCLIEKDLSDCQEPVRGLTAGVNAAKGKMIRPALILLSGLACGKITQEHINAAAIFEMIHNVSLLHDDVIDEAKFRRGVPTVNSLHGNESAVLLGDFLLGKVMGMCTRQEKKIVEIIAGATMKTCEGELKQISQRGNWLINETEYLDIISGKTAALFEAACQTGAVLAGSDAKIAQAFSAYGRNLGIAFQITDDLLDLVGEQSKTGKTEGNDLDRNKLTLPLIHLLKKVEDTELQKIRKILRQNDGEPDKLWLIKKLTECSSIEYSIKTAQKFAQDAVASISNFVDNQGGKALIETAKFIVGRTS